MSFRPTDQRPRLVIVDDDTDQLNLLRMAAERLGAFSDVTATSDAEMALEGVQEHLRHSPASSLIVLTDLRMPRVNASEFIGKLTRCSGPELLQVAVMSNSDYPPDVAAAKAAGCAMFLQKPSGFRELKQMLLKVASKCVAHEEAPSYDFVPQFA